MSVSKAWEWNIVTDPLWTTPSEESYYLAARWKAAGCKRILDFGCGLGRHAVFFARQGFEVSAFDLSPDGVAHLTDWAEREKLPIEAQVSDMAALPYPDGAFDAVFAYHVMYHTDTKGMNNILGEIMRVLKKDGEFYLTLGSKESRSYLNPAYPRLDANTVIKTEDGPEKDVPHFYVDLDDIVALFRDHTLCRVRHTDECYMEGQKYESRHYFVLGKP